MLGAEGFEDVQQVPICGLDLGISGNALNDCSGANHCFHQVSTIDFTVVVDQEYSCGKCCGEKNWPCCWVESISGKPDIGPGTEARWTTTKLILTA
jgi:hypothetical protein